MHKNIRKIGEQRTMKELISLDRNKKIGGGY